MRALLTCLALAASSAFAADADEVATAARALSDPDAKVRQEAASLLWKKEKAAAPARDALLKALDDPSPAVAIRAAGALGAIGMTDAELAPARTRVLDAVEAKTEDRFMAARGLVGYAQPAQLAPAMLAYLEEYPTGNNADSSRRTLERLAKTGDREIIAPVVEALRRASKPKAKTILIATLAVFPPRAEDVAAWGPQVAAMLRDPDSPVRNEALWAFEKAAGLAASHAGEIVPLLSDPEPSIRKRAAAALGEIGDPTQAIMEAAKADVAQRARPALAKLEGDPDAEVRAEAKAALAKLGSESALTPAKPLVREAQAVAALRGANMKVDPGSAFRALMMGDLAAVRSLLDAGLSPTSNVAGNGAPLYVALQWSPTACSPAVRPTSPATKAMVRMLVERGADVNQGDANGNTPLMAAASHGCDREVMRALIAAGAKVDAVGKTGLTAFEQGLAFGHDGLEEIIVAGYRLPPEKAKAYEQAYGAKPASLALVRKASRK